MRLENGWFGGEVCVQLGLEAYHLEDTVSPEPPRGGSGENASEAEEQRGGDTEIQGKCSGPQSLHPSSLSGTLIS